MQKNAVYFFILPFIVVQALALFLAQRVYTLGFEEQIQTGGASWVPFIGSIIVFAFLVLVVRRFLQKKAGVIFRIFFYLALLASFDVFLSVLILNPWVRLAGSLFMFVSYIVWKSVAVHDILIIIAFSSIAAVVGLSFLPLHLVFALAILSVYDFVAVFKTKHMQKMAHELISHAVIPAFIIPTSLSFLSEGRHNVRPGEGKFMILGGGDLVLPAALSVAVLRIGLLPASLVAVFVIVGAGFTYALFSFGKSGALPALPSLALFAISGYISSILII